MESVIGFHGSVSQGKGIKFPASLGLKKPFAPLPLEGAASLNISITLTVRSHQRHLASTEAPADLLMAGRQAMGKKCIHTCL